MKSATIIFPHQLFDKHPALAKDRPVFLVEHPRFFTDFRFHKQKLILHRASLQRYKKELKKKKYAVTYLEYHEAKNLWKHLATKKIEELHCADVTDHALDTELTKLAKKHSIDLVLHESPSFLCSTEWIEDYYKGKKKFFMHPFYVAQRKRLNILVRNNKPVGGKWTFDHDNRKKAPANLKVPSIKAPRTTDELKEAERYVAKHFNNNPGTTSSFIYPTSSATAKKWLSSFLKERFKLFGDYQDAIVIDEPFMFHSLLSSSINIGLLTPEYVVQTALDYAKKHKVPINSVEGFIRQIIGWREFVRAVYHLKGKQQAKSNFFNHRRKLPSSFWDATTGITPIDTTIEGVLDHAYAHHIERLMILGNFMLLCHIKPHDVYTWFMELFIDSYDWVMVPNVYGMALYADGGMMTTKPYISSSNYLLKMSNYKKNEWNKIWDALYWYFIYSHKSVIQKTGRLAIMGSYLKRMKKSTLQEHIKTAKAYLRSL